jgi:hypothetical protein
MLSHRGNINQNTTAIPSHPTQNGYHQNKTTTTKPIAGEEAKGKRNSDIEM